MVRKIYNVRTVTVTTERIGVLDVLRGIALLGMFLVHFNDFSTGQETNRLAAAYRVAVPLFFEERFWAMFGILFGVGFAVQLRRAEASGRPFVAMYLRRMLALAGFGLIAHAVFGFNVLLGYAAWGVPLLFVRKWPLKILVIALVISASSGAVFYIARAGYRVAAVGETAYRAQVTAAASQARAFNQSNRKAQDAPDYLSVLSARLAHMNWFYRQPFSFLPVNTFTLFLIGVIGLRLGVFDDPRGHRRTIVALMIFGAVSWLLEQWPRSDQGEGPIIQRMIGHYARSAFGLARGMWLTFVYIGAVLLLVARDPAWLRRLAAFGWAGRMALTLYMVQIAILDLMFSTYAFHVELGPLAAVGAGLALFGLMAVLSRWWLTRYRFGPLEWLWRSITHGKPQPLKLSESAPATVGVA